MLSRLGASLERRPWLAALLVGLIGGLPHLAIPTFQMAADSEVSYSPLAVVGSNSMVFDEVNTYASDVRSLADGRGFKGDIYTWEYREAHGTMWHPVPGVLVALLARTFGSVEAAFIAADFIFPALLYWVAHFLFRAFFSGSQLGVTVVLGFLIVPHFVPFLAAVWNMDKLRELPTALAGPFGGFRRWLEVEDWRGRPILARAVLGLAPLILLWGGAAQVSVAARTYQGSRIPAGLSQSYDWLEENGRGQVVMTSSLEAILMLSAFTDCYRYCSGGTLSMVPSEEIFTRALVGFKILGVPPERVSELLVGSREIMPALRDRGYIFRRDQLERHWQYFLAAKKYVTDVFPRHHMPEEVRRAWVKRYEDLPADPGALLDLYRVDLLLWTPRDEELATRGPRDMSSWFVEVFRAPGGYAIYRVVQGPPPELPPRT